MDRLKEECGVFGIFNNKDAAAQAAKHHRDDSPRLHARAASTAARPARGSNGRRRRAPHGDARVQHGRPVVQLRVPEAVLVHPAAAGRLPGHGRRRRDRRRGPAIKTGSVRAVARQGDDGHGEFCRGVGRRRGAPERHL